MKKLLGIMAAALITAAVYVGLGVSASGSVPLAHIDSPNRTYITGSLSISGWSLNKSGVKTVEIFINGKKAGSARTGLYRPDVDNAKNSTHGYKGAVNSGFTFSLNTSGYKPGTYKITVLSTGFNGTTAKYSKIIYKADPVSHIDNSGSLLITDALSLRGWALSSSGVNTIKVYIDGNFFGSTKTGLARTDVSRTMNADGRYLENGDSGFSFCASETDKLSVGEHEISVISVGNDGVTAKYSAKAKKLTPHINIESPKSNQKVTGNLTVSGWAIAASGINKVQILLDGKAAGNAVTGITRNDVKKMYGSGYKNADKSGYSYCLDTSSLATGAHKVTVKAYSNDGGTFSTAQTFNLTKASPVANIDTPKNGNGYITDSLTVSGWSLSASGVKSVEVFIDDKSVGKAATGLLRTDVDSKLNASKCYKDADKSGYTLTLADVSAYSSGLHTVKVISTGFDGNTASYTSKVEKAVPKAGFDVNSYTVGSDITVTGYALSPSGVSKIEIYCGDILLGQAVTGLDSSAVAVSADPKGLIYKNSTASGFSFVVPYNSVPLGNENLIAKAYGNDGSVFTCSSGLTVNKPSPIGSIDSPVSGANLTYCDKTITISGWALNPSGVASIHVFLDSVEITDVTTGLPSDDKILGIANGRYLGEENARFKTNPIDISGLCYGSHTVKVTVTGNDSSTQEMTVGFNKSQIKYTNYNITVASIASKHGLSTSYFDPNTIINADGAGIYEFMTLSYIDGITADDLNSMLKDRGVLAGKGQVFLDAAKQYNVNPVYLVAHARVESGNGTSKLSKGVYIPAGTYTLGGSKITVSAGTYYNQFGIKAVDNDPISQGSLYAAKCGWNSVDASILGGAKFISEIYIHGGKPDQDTLYTMKWDPGYWDGTYARNYEYATAASWAHSIANIISQYKYVFNGIPLTFDIPKYKG